MRQGLSSQRGRWPDSAGAIVSSPRRAHGRPKRFYDGSVRTVVVGAGIGGLGAAIALEQAGAESIVIERAPKLHEAGFGLVVSANAVTALRSLGLRSPVKETRQQGGLHAPGGDRAMSRAILDLSISLDGYAAGPNISLENPLGDNGSMLVFDGAGWQRRLDGRGPSGRLLRRHDEQG